MVIEEESFDELDEINDHHTFDESYEALKELHNDLKKISIKSISLKKKLVEL